MPYARMGLNPARADGDPTVVRDASGFEAAKQKAYHLLMSILPSEEQTRLETLGNIQVRGRRHRYVISPHTQTELFKNGRRVGFACLQLTIAAPVYDRMLAEYLLIKHDERAYLRTANVAHESSGSLQLVLGLAISSIVAFLLGRVTIQLVNLLS
jgi:hypothetical protein